ncbi:bacterial regulatory helix-turn-helix/ lysR family protein [Synechococcus sp. BIOS-E4-1]|uniref:LysR family transcriptional regulator n=1 Tax=Synechococcus sp. BIOS-E4-1 TaxID=1400864 RepID=UPI001647C9EE|nr:LysR family transcriptional regulator [Synechococcus sp. BIOS-E4-1]QNI52755.1 bacterial regulatory helix-turn-helix/ lysR family protein [Synechococcus sp. BIOS-E4-1]
MDLSQIKAFLAVSEFGSFTKAAKFLHLSQPSISLKVIALEKHLKTTLIHRENNKIHLSESGRYAQEKLEHVVKQIEELEHYFDNQEKQNKLNYTIYHESDVSMSALKQVILHIESTLGEEITTHTFQCNSEQEIIDLLKKDTNAFGLSRYKTDSNEIKSRLITDEEFMLVYSDDDLSNKESIDLCELLSKRVFLPELHSESLHLLETRIRPFGLDITDFTKRSHVSEKLMEELIRDAGGIGIKLCNTKVPSNCKRIRVNELSTPYGLFLLAHKGKQGEQPNSNDLVFSADLNYQFEDNYPPILPRLSKASQKQSNSPITVKHSENKVLKIGIQNRTIQTVVSGRAIQKLGLLDSFIAEISDSSQNQFSTKWIDYKSAAPMLKGLKESELDIAIIGDYAISHMATNQSYNDENGPILISFVSINPYGSGSSLLIRKDIKETELKNLKNNIIAVPFLSTAHGSLLYNLNQNNILSSARLINISLENQKTPFDNSMDAGAVACFTPFDHIISAEHHYQKVEDEVSTPFAFYGVVARRQFAVQQPDIVIAFLKSMLCSNYWFKNTTSSIQHLSRWTGVDMFHINYILGERHGKDGHYQPDMKIREDWIEEYTEKIFIENQRNKSTVSKRSSIVQTEYLDSAMRDLGMTKF